MGCVAQGHSDVRGQSQGLDADGLFWCPGEGGVCDTVLVVPSFQMAALGEARLREMEAMQSLRLANEGKWLSPAPDVEAKVCVCQKAPAAPMVQCELCRDAFHTSCVALSGAAQGPRIWLCPHCRRSEKPPLEKILPLLASLQRIRVRLPEGDALRYMIERTVSWQHRAQHLLSSGSLRAAHGRTGPGLSQSKRQAPAGLAAETSKVSHPSSASLGTYRVACSAQDGASGALSGADPMLFMCTEPSPC